MSGARIRPTLFIWIALSVQLGWAQKAPPAIRWQFDVPVPMRDGVVLRADVYLPEKEGKYPVILIRSPYGKGANEKEAVAYAPHGYVVVAQDTRGRFESDGEWYAFAHEAQDGYDSVEWAARQVWSNGKVATTGGSYLAIDQWLAASERPPHLAAMVTIVTPSDLYANTIHPGGSYQYGTALTWGLATGRRTNLIEQLKLVRWPEIFRILPVEVAASRAAAEEVEEGIQTALVVVDGVTLFSVRGVSAYPAQRRADMIAERIRSVAADRNFSPQSLRLEETPVGTRILAGNLAIMTVFDPDAQLEGVSRRVLARVLSARIGEAIQAFRHNRAPDFLASRILYALLATLAFLLGWWFGQRIVRRIRSTLKRHYEEKVRRVQIQAFQIVQAEQLWRLLAGVLSLVWVLVILGAAYVYLHYALSLFPWTRGMANSLFGILVNPLRTMGSSLLREVPNLVFLAFVVLITWYVLKLTRLFFAGIEKGKITFADFDPAWARPTYRLVRIAVVAFALVVAYPYIPGSGSQAFKGVSLFMGVVFSLGSTSLIGNMIAGYSMVYRRAFKVGDRIKVGDHIGDVENTGLMVTYLRTLKNEMVAVPNSMIINGEIINYSTLARKEGLILHATVGIGYETSWRQVEAMLLEAAARTPGLLREPKPFVLQKELGDFAVTYEVNAYCDEPRAMLPLYTALRQNILDLFNEYGVQIMTPAYRSDPAQAKIVPKDQWYAAPARPPASREPGSPKVEAAGDVEEAPPFGGAT